MTGLTFRAIVKYVWPLSDHANLYGTGSVAIVSSPMSSSDEQSVSKHNNQYTTISTRGVGGFSFQNLPTEPYTAKLATPKFLDLGQVIGLNLLQGGRDLHGGLLDFRPLA